MIQAVLFDAGNTLLTFNGTMADIVEQAFAGQSIRLTAEQRRQVEPLMWRYYAHYQAQRGLVTSVEESWEFWRLVYRAICRDLSLPRVEELGELLLEAFTRPDAWRPFPDVLPALDALAARGLRLGVISNWTVGLHGILTGLGLAGYFEFVLTSAEAGYEKPAPNIYALALQGRNLQPGECLYVGDSLDNDADSSRSFGMEFALIDRDGRHAGAGYRRVSDLRDLLGLVEMAG